MAYRERVAQSILNEPKQIGVIQKKKKFFKNSKTVRVAAAAAAAPSFKPEGTL